WRNASNKTGTGGAPQRTRVRSAVRNLFLLKVVNLQLHFWDTSRILLVACGLLGVGPSRTYTQEGQQGCTVQSVTFHGWPAERMSNRWVTLTVVPKLGGRLMQAAFGRHEYLFVNPRYYGAYFPPSEGADKGKWFNYGGDKDWPLPEGGQDESHWRGDSDTLDDGIYTAKVLSSGKLCSILLQGPPDIETGLQYSRQVSIDSESPRISFHAVMRNASGHRIRWSIQSVSQYNTADPDKPGSYNHDFWAFTPTNPSSAFNRQFDVHSGPVDHPSYRVRDGKMFALHWSYLEGEVGIDSPAGWVALVDGLSHYAMVERMTWGSHAQYPDRSSTIFYINGPQLRLDGQGMPHMTSADVLATPYYMEAELNSPLVELKPGDSYSFDTEWFPTRATPSLTGTSDAGVINEALTATLGSNGVQLAGSFGVFYSGRLKARFYSFSGVPLGSVPVVEVSPLKLVSLHQTVEAPAGSGRVSLHLVDATGSDKGGLGEVPISGAGAKR
ncbi:MAG: hypothetical protein ACRD3T_00625, partial [Terriglobia bacterium]